MGEGAMTVRVAEDRIPVDQKSFPRSSQYLRDLASPSFPTTLRNVDTLG